MNSIVLTGNIVRNIDLHRTPNSVVVNNCIAVRRDKDNTDFIEFTAYGAQAEYMANYLGKGAKIAIVGSLQTNKWQTKEGENRSNLFVMVSRLESLERFEKEANDTHGSVEEKNEEALKQFDDNSYGLPF